MSSLNIAQVALEAWGAVFCAISVLIMSFSIAKSKRSANVIQWLFLVNMNNLIADACAYIFRGKISRFSVFMTRFCNFFVVITLYVMVVLAAHYVFCILRENTGKSYKSLLYVVGGIIVIPTLIAIVNLFNGCMYYFDEENFYHRGRLYYGTMGIVLLAMYFILVMVIINRKKIGMLTASAICIYLLLPVIMMGIQLFWYGLSLVNLGITIALILMLLAYQKEQSNMYQRQQDIINHSRMGLLLGQIRPDFVRDMLHSVEEYCVTDSLRAREMIKDLGGYLHDTFNYMQDESLITFEQEMELIDYYMNLVTARNSQIVFQKVIEVQDFKVPPLSLVPIVENAVHHGLKSAKKAGHIMVKAFATEKEYMVVVFDDGVGFNDEDAKSVELEGAGIDTVRDRLKYMVKGSIEIESHVGEGTAVAVHIPKSK